MKTKRILRGGYGRFANAARLVLLLFMCLGVSSVHAANVDLTGTWQWTDTSNTTGASYSGPAQIVGGANGTFSWTWIDGWSGTGTVSGTTWTMTGSTGSFSATWNSGTITQSGTALTMTGNWSQSDNEVGTTTATLTSATDHLAFTVQPSTTKPNSPFNPAVQVTILNPQNTADTGAADAIQLSLSGGTSGAVLSSTTATATGGVATFNNLSVNLAGQNYVLTATDTTNTLVSGATSTAFNVVQCETGGVSSQICLQKTGSVTGTGTGTLLSYTLTLQNGTGTAISGIQVADSVVPAFNVKKPNRAATSPESDPITWPNPATNTTADTGTINWSKFLPTLSADPTSPISITYSLTPGDVTVPNGITLGLSDWTADGWQTTSTTMPPAIVRGGGDLVFSDNPEYLAATTADSLGHTHGEFIEGVLYKQTSQSTLLPGSGPLTSNGTFRLYMNHENRTTVPKRLYYVITNPSTVDSVDVSMGNFGIAHKPGDPVVAGQRALEQYLGGAVASAIPPPSLPPNQPCAGSALFTTIPHGMTCVFFVYELSQPTVTNEGTYPDVVNFIADITTTGPVQVGVVAVNGAPNNYSNFEVLPLNYEFNNTIGLTYQTDQLVNLTEKGHVHGTFPYNHVQVRIPYAVANADRYGWRLGDNTPSSPEYAVSRDAIPSLNIGNFGVQYVVSIVPSGAQSGMATQVLIEPRGARPRTDSTTGNAVAAEVTTSSIASPFAVPCNGKITDPNTGAGVGFVLGNDTFVLNLIPPAGDTMPIAVVLGPAYVKNTATATAPSGATSSSSLVLQLPDPNAGIALCAPAD